MERLIAYHCAPALAGIKPANIVSCEKRRFKNAAAEIARLNAQLNKKGIHFTILCECERRILLMVYRENKLSQYLQAEEIGEFLREAGYPEKFELGEYIERLQRRMGNESFPHEIGAFLGYPLCDIYGFINKEKCLLTGEWKVYKNAEDARLKFQRYSVCKCALVKRIDEGRSLSELFAA